jgi:serine phosphatase RsbU (regulator of sigma subunit)
MDVFLRAKKGEVLCGDKYIIKQYGKGTLYILIDAIGHGKEASLIAGITSQLIEDSINMKLPNIIEACNAKLSGTRGAVICFVFYLPEENKAYYYSVGNISCLLVSNTRVVKLNSIPGIFGLKNLDITLSEVETTEKDRLLMFTDGATELKAESYAQLQKMNSRHLVQMLSETWTGQDDICCICEQLHG